MEDTAEAGINEEEEPRVLQNATTHNDRDDREKGMFKMSLISFSFSPRKLIRIKG